MQNLHDDKNLDRLAREAADEFQPDPSLHSWGKLKPGLDRELPEKKEKKRRFIFILFFFLLVGGGIVSALWLNRNETPQQAVTTANDAKTSSGNDVNGNKQLPVSPGSTNSTKATAAPVTKPQNAVDVVDATNNSRRITPKQIDERANTGKQNQTRRNNNPVTNIDKKKAIAKNVTTDIVNDEPNVTDDMTAKQDKVVADKTTTDNKNPVEDKTVADDKVVAENKPVADNKTSSAKEQPTATEKPATNKAKLKSTSRNPSVAASRWEFGAVYAPDISTVKFTHTQKPGTNVGLMVGYNISRRFAMQAGAIYTIKKYKSRGSDYHPPKGYWTDYVKLETVTADCDMWDIPINLRYNLVPRHRSNLFVTTGLSSYLMGSEDYNYRYYYANNPNPMSRYRTYDTNSKHWASILNLSIGYERQINKSFSIQAEPFFKQPLKGVGFGGVKLNSTGIYFSVKYKPVSKSRK